MLFAIPVSLAQEHLVGTVPKSAALIYSNAQLDPFYALER